MTKDEALKLALDAFGEIAWSNETQWQRDRAKEAITAIKEALAQPEPKYHRGNRLICLETEEYCVIHISGTDRQWVKFPDSYIGVYTNEQVAELFELLPKETEQKPVAWMDDYNACKCPDNEARCFSDKVFRMMQKHTNSLAKQQEPVAKVCHDLDGHIGWNPNLKQLPNEGTPLYTTPPQRTWAGLTDKEIDQGLLRSDYAFKTAEAWRAGVVFAMTKLKEKNT